MVNNPNFILSLFFSYGYSMASKLCHSLIHLNMIDQTILVSKILKDLNFSGIATSTIEKELPIASGYLYKVKMGIKTLGEEKLKELQDYHAKKIKKDKEVVIKIPSKNVSQPAIKKEEPKVEKKLSLASYLGPRPNMVKFSKKIR